MAKHNILVKNLATIETLGCTSVLCSDKTGTLTVGQMVRVFLIAIFAFVTPFPSQSVQNIAFIDIQYPVDEIAKSPSAESGRPAPLAVKALHAVARLCNEAKFDDTGISLPIEERTVKGNATDVAVLRFAESLSLPSIGVNSDTLLASHIKMFEIPFNSRNKWMLSVVCQKDNIDPWMLVKGAPDVLYPKCATVLRADGTVIPIDSAIRIQLDLLQADWSSQGQRVLALCRKSLPAFKVDTSTMSANDLEDVMYSELQGMTLVGLVGIRDPPRYDVKDAISVIRRAGVRVFMVTGDFRLTALAIARQVMR
jgi:sodium/potassium-transporting ATPase subunit alpha